MEHQRLGLITELIRAANVSEIIKLRDSLSMSKDTYEAKLESLSKQIEEVEISNQLLKESNKKMEETNKVLEKVLETQKKDKKLFKRIKYHVIWISTDPVQAMDVERSKIDILKLLNERIDCSCHTEDCKEIAHYGPCNCCDGWFCGLCYNDWHNLCHPCKKDGDDRFSDIKS